MSLSCFDADKDLSNLNIEQLKEEYIYMAYYTCNFYFGDDGTVTYFTIDKLASAE